MDNPHNAIILSKPLRSISEPQRRRIDFSIWSNQNKLKYFSGSNLSNNLHWSYFDNLHTGWLLSSTVVLSFQRSPCNDVVHLVCVRAHQLREKLLKCQVFLYVDSSGNGNESMQPVISCLKPCNFVWYSVFITAVRSGRAWCRRQYRSMVSFCNEVRKFFMHV